MILELQNETLKKEVNWELWKKTSLKIEMSQNYKHFWHSWTIKNSTQERNWLVFNPNFLQKMKIRNWHLGVSNQGDSYGEIWDRIKISINITSNFGNFGLALFQSEELNQKCWKTEVWKRQDALDSDLETRDQVRGQEELSIGRSKKVKNKRRSWAYSNYGMFNARNKNGDWWIQSSFGKNFPLTPCWKISGL